MRTLHLAVCGAPPLLSRAVSALLADLPLHARISIVTPCPEDAHDGEEGQGREKGQAGEDGQTGEEDQAGEEPPTAHLDGIVWCAGLDGSPPGAHDCPVLVLDLLGRASGEAPPQAPVLGPDTCPRRLAEAIQRTFLCPEGEPAAPYPPPLSPREEQFMRLYAKGRLLKQIAFTLGVSPNTLKTYRRRIQDKYERCGVQLPDRLSFHKEARRRFPDFDDDPEPS